jgi:hypothetical protein
VRTVRSTVALMVALVAAALAPSASASATGGYSVSGNQILDPSGAPIRFKGINGVFLDLHTTDINVASNGITTAESVAQMKRWGFDLVRIELSSTFWLNDSCATPVGAYKTRVDDAVNAVTSRGMVAEIDLHTGNADGTLSCATTWLNPMADAPHALEFWAQVAARYGSNPLVAFDLYNEPILTPMKGTVPAGVDPDLLWRNGGTAIGGYGPYAVAGMQQMYDTVRANGGTNNLIIISGQGPTANGNAGSYDIRVALRTPVTGFNIVYASHPYTPGNCGSLPPDPTGIAAVDAALPPPGPSDLNEVILPVAAVHPVIFDELGTNCGTTLAGEMNNAALIAYANKHGLSYAAFGWDKTYTTSQGVHSWGVLADFTTWAPSDYGKPFYADLHGQPCNLVCL